VATALQARYPGAMAAPIPSVPHVCDVEYVRGAAAARNSAPDLLLEVAHGATRARDFDGWRERLRGTYGDDLRDFFFVNTDVGAPELAVAVARQVVARAPRRTAVVVRCLVPRTLVDCNRRVERTAVAAASSAGQMTPGLQPWVQDPADRDALLDAYFAYRDTVTAAFAQVAAANGPVLFVHSYAPRSIDVAVDAHIGATLRAAYAPDRIGSWPLRPPVDLILRDPDGKLLASPELARAAADGYRAAGFDVTENATYPLHPVTLAHAFAVQRPDATLCLELRRDLLVPEFVPFVELHADAAKIERAAAPLAAAVTAAPPP
jgi:hypothetical protein